MPNTEIKRQEAVPDEMIHKEDRVPDKDTQGRKGAG